MAYISKHWLLPSYAIARDRKHKPAKVFIKSGGPLGRSIRRPDDAIISLVISENSELGPNAGAFKILFLTKEDIQSILPDLINAGGADAIGIAMSRMSEADLIGCLAKAFATRKKPLK